MSIKLFIPLQKKIKAFDERNKKGQMNIKNILLECKLQVKK